MGILLLILAAELDAQEAGELQGVVRSLLDSTPIARASITVYRMSSTGRPTRSPAILTETDSEGRFYLAPEVGRRIAIIARASGYRPDTTITFIGVSTERVDFALEPSAVEMEPVHVVTASTTREGPHPVLGLSRNASELRVIPPAMGVEDPIRALAAEPGVRLANPYSARLSVRGSDPSGTGTYLNGFPAYGIQHMGGVFGALPASAVNGVDLWTAAMPPRFSGYSGSVLDLDVMPPAAAGQTVTGTASIMGLEVAGTRTGSSGHALRVAGRRSVLNSLWANAVNAKTFGLHDYVASGRFAISEAWHIAFLGYTSGDVIRDSAHIADALSATDTVLTKGYERGSDVLGARITGLLGRERVLRIGSWYSRASAGGESIAFGGRRADASNRVQEHGVSAEIEQVMGGFDLLVGLTARGVTSSSNVRYLTSLSGPGPGDTEASYFRVAGRHTELKGYWHAAGRVGFLGTLMASAVASKAASSLKIEPALVWEKRIGQGIQIHAALSRRYQRTFLMTDPREEPWGEAASVDIWFIASDSTGSASIPELRADQALIGATFDAGHGLTIDGDIYFKALEDVPELFATPYRDAGPPLLNTVSGTATGVEAGLRWRSGGPWLVASHFSWSRSWRSSDGEEYSSDFDVPHRLRVLVSYAPNQGWFASTDMAIESGYPYTRIAYSYPRRQFDPYSGFVDPVSGSGNGHIYGQRNAARYPATHRLDLRVGYRGGKSDAFRWEAFAAIVNLTGGQSVPLEPDGSSTPPGLTKVGFDERYEVPPIPLIGIRVEF